jgi:integrase
MALTVRRVERTTKPGRYGDGKGLWLQVVNPRNRSWLFRYERNGVEKTLGLGPAHTVSLELAREKAQACRLLLLDGVDPLEHRDAERAARAAARARAITFAEAAASYHNQHESKWRNRKHAAQFLSTLKQYVFPHIGALPVAEIDRPLIIRVLEQPIEAERGYPAGPFWKARPETASRVRGRIETVLDWCTGRGFRSGENPAAWAPLKAVLPKRDDVAKVEHHAALPWREIPTFMAQLASREGSAARALEFLVLTAARTGEVIDADWEEIKGDVWTIPAGRMKARKEHRIPLSKRALELLESLLTEDGNPHVFVGPRAGSGLSNMSLTMVLRRMRYGAITVHGFRSSFRDWAAETTSFPNHVIEMALAHVVGDKVEAAYRRGELLLKRRQLAEAWGRYCSSAASVGAVVPLKRKAGGHV